MKLSIKSISVFIALLALLSCNKEKQEFTLGLDMQINYAQDIVELRLDGTEIFKDTISTDHTTGLAALTRFQVQEGSHTLKVIVNNNQSRKTEFDLLQDQYIGISFDRNNVNAITLAFSDEPFVYF